ncbi:hypothetical protein TNCV_1871091 [Trichonephila clavipes]|nr:hypothetical protein TNCV_1871091 [Trichonephila clavipes]
MVFKRCGWVFKKTWAKLWVFDGILYCVRDGGNLRSQCEMEWICHKGIHEGASTKYIEAFVIPLDKLQKVLQEKLRALRTQEAFNGLFDFSIASKAPYGEMVDPQFIPHHNPKQKIIAILMNVVDELLKKVDGMIKANRRITLDGVAEELGIGQD